MAEETATFAGGCFWGMEHWFKKQFPRGIVRTTVGFTGGKKAAPSYRDVCTGQTGHAEAVEIVFDPRVVSYDELLALFWRVHDPTTRNRQGNDVGSQYRSAIFVHSPEQQAAAERSRERAKEHWGPGIVTEIVPAAEFFPAEEYHQDYLDHNPGGYCEHRLHY